MKRTRNLVMDFSAVEFALNTIGELNRQVTSLLGVDDQIESLERELRWMTSFLKVADSRKLDNDVARTAIAEIRELAYDVEDVIETFALKVVSQRKLGFSNCVKRSVCFLNEGCLLHRTRSEIEKITVKIQELTRQFKTYDVTKLGNHGQGPSSSAERQEWRRPYPHIIDDNIVGLDTDVKKLVSVIVDEKSESRVVSICGMGGLGKTTLAKKIYHHNQVKNHFDHLAWVYVSEQCQKRKVWTDILSSLKITFKVDWQTRDEEITEELFNFLKKKKCLVIVDDIWNNEAWDSIKHAFPEKETRTKILLTSRNTEVVSHADRKGYLYRLQFLNREQSWELFQKIAFSQVSAVVVGPACDAGELVGDADIDSGEWVQDSGGKVEGRMEELGKNMVEHCAGLPLAIVVLGGILVTKDSINEWQMVSDNVISYVKRGKGHGVEEVLALSYDDLPHYLRPCFLYLANFPEDFEIQVDRLIQLWVAEGIVFTEEEVIEDLAERYLMELVQRCMVQVRDRDVANLKIITVQMHDLMRNLCLSKAKQENFLFSVDESNASSISTVRRIHRVSAPNILSTQCIKSPNLRSILLFGEISDESIHQMKLFRKPLLRKMHKYVIDNEDRADNTCLYVSIAAFVVFFGVFPEIQGYYTYMFNNFKLLRVFSYDGKDIEQEGWKLSGDIGNLIHLRFLSLRGVDFVQKILPSSLGNLRRLQTLDLSVSAWFTDSVHVPNVIWRMEQLRHLYLPYKCDRKTKLKLDTLRNLQTLVNFNTKNCHLKDLINMTNIRELVIRGPFEIKDFNAEDSDKNPPVIQGRYLHSLSIINDDGRIDPRHLNHLLSSCVCVCKLILAVEITELPKYFSSSSNLAYLNLRWCNFEEDPMPTLEKLPSLRVLELNALAFKGKEMCCATQGFPKLEYLSLDSLQNLEEWKVDDGAMPCLRRLEIERCRELKMVPDGLRVRLVFCWRVQRVYENRSAVGVLLRPSQFYSKRTRNLLMDFSSVEFALNTIGELNRQVTSLLGVDDQIESLERELRWMKSFLKVADARKLDNDVARTAIAEIRELAYDVEDVIETFALKVASQRKPGFSNCIKRSVCFLNEGCLLHRTRSEIEKITIKIQELTRQFKTYDVTKLGDHGEGPSSSSERRESRRPYPHVMDYNVVGMDGDIKELVSVLVEEGGESKVVSICGMGGLGKTTLAKKIYRHTRVAGHFSHLVLVYVSQQCQKRKVWEDILSGLKKLDKADRKRIRDENLAEELYNFLKDEKCLVILDDIWRSEDWDSLKPAFPVETDSKILITSRNKEIISHADRRGYLHELQCLNNEQSWELFQKIVFSQADSRENRVDAKMIELGEGMVKHCAGLPLAIVVLGGILVTKNDSLHEWQKVSANVNSYLRRDKTGRIEDVLELSYDDLPPYLRPCFLYLSHFPEDYEIHMDRLIKLLVAEGVVSPKQGGDDGEIAEDLVEGYLMELVERYMIQVRERDIATLEVKTLQMHDLMRDLCLSKAKQDNFIFLVDQSNASSLSSIQRARRVSAHKFFRINRINSPMLRSLIFFDGYTVQDDALLQKMIDSANRHEEDDDALSAIMSFSFFAIVLLVKLQRIWTYVLNNFKLLRVLDCEHVYDGWGCKLPNEIGNLIHLRFLSLRGREFLRSKLPSSLGNLRRLQTLDLRVRAGLCTGGAVHVPNVIWRMEQLRHLYLPYKCNCKTKLKLGTLRNLQTLVNFNTENCYLKDLINMTNIRELVIRGPFEIKDFNAEDSDKNPPVIQGRYLHSLYIFNDKGIIDPRHLNHLLSSCVSVCKLTLDVEIGELPEYVNSSSNLAYLNLSMCKLEEDPMSTLEKLASLRALELNSLAFKGKEMYCSTQGFPKLESLTLAGLPNLEEWKVDDGAMPCLRRLEIECCPELKMVPDGLRSITMLQELEIKSMPKMFMDKLVEGGEDFCKVRHYGIYIILHDGVLIFYGMVDMRFFMLIRSILVGLG
ncbi:hypothetical protein GQ457_02G039560 [Hibiscus cannabinus]